MEDEVKTGLTVGHFSPIKKTEYNYHNPTTRTKRHETQARFWLWIDNTVHSNTHKPVKGSTKHRWLWCRNAIIYFLCWVCNILCICFYDHDHDHDHDHDL